MVTGPRHLQVENRLGRPGSRWDDDEVREAERPANQRISLLDRPRTANDGLPEARLLSGAADRLDPTSIRRALVVDDLRIYIGRGFDEEDLFQMYFDAHGGGSAGGPRSTLATHGARVGWSTNDHRCVAWGIVPDPVLAVRVGDVEAVVANNAFMAVVRAPGEDVVLTSADREHVVPSPMKAMRDAFRLNQGPTTRPDGSGYVGTVEHAWSGYSKVEIDDLDSPTWTGTFAGPFLRVAGAPDVRPVGVVLLEGSRAGELAMADLVTALDGDEPSVTFVGTTPFGPHPDPPRLPDALRQYEQRHHPF